ncbi:MAG TPA: ATP-binding protein [Candidatus Binatus sp.]|nr:ATP-binding protein [Candidatus Binatus sp.]
MTDARRAASLRWRLTFWYTAALGGLLLGLGVTAFVLLDRTLRANVDASLASVARAIAASSQESAPLAPDLDETLAALFGPALAERFRLLDPLGRPDPRLAPRSRSEFPLSPDARRNAADGRETFETLAMPGVTSGPVRLLTFPVVDRGRLVHLVQVAMPLAGVDAARRRFLLILVGLAPVALAGIAVGGWVLTGRALAPVDAMVAAARRIGAEDLSLRLAGEDRDDELGRLAAVLNDMLARLDRSFTAVRHFSADAAHELRTPLTILKGELEVALRTARWPEEYRRVLESCQEEVDRLVALVEDLLLLARTDAGAVDHPHEPVDLGAVIDDVTPALRALAERAGVALVMRHPGTVMVHGSGPMLFRVLFNLVDNAIKYSGAGRQVEVTLGTHEGSAVLEVRDDGPGIAPADQAHVFDRFYRGDPAHTRGGAGLGLALARAIVQVHGGRITLESTPGRGTCFRVLLPLAPPAD